MECNMSNNANGAPFVVPPYVNNPYTGNAWTSSSVSLFQSGKSINFSVNTPDIVGGIWLSGGLSTPLTLIAHVSANLMGLISGVPNTVPAPDSDTLFGLMVYNSGSMESLCVGNSNTAGTAVGQWQHITGSIGGAPTIVAQSTLSTQPWQSATWLMLRYDGTYTYFSIGDESGKNFQEIQVTAGGGVTHIGVCGFYETAGLTTTATLNVSVDSCIVYPY